LFRAPRNHVLLILSGDGGGLGSNVDK